MKNYIPLILAVILGFAAIVVVNRNMNKNPKAQIKEVEVVATTRQITKGDVIKESDLKIKRIPVTAQPANAVPATKMNWVIGQNAHRPIPAGDYIYFDDVPLDRPVIVGKGEWAIMLRFEKSSITQLIRPGDDIAIIATINVRESKNAVNADGVMEEKVSEREVTTVLLPRVRVISVGAAPVMTGASGMTRTEESEMLMSLPPEQAQLLLAAKSMARLDLALRRPNDDSALSRSDIKMVDASSFTDLIKGMKPVQLPDMPYKPSATPAPAP